MREESMTKFLLTAFAWLASAGFAQAQTPDCKHSETAVATTGAPKKSTLTLLGTTPPAGAELRKDMTLGVDVEFQVADFAPDAYYLLVMFPTSGRGSMSPNDQGSTPALQSASGKAHLCAPLTEVYGHPTVKWPLSIDVMLLRVGPDGSGSGTTRSRLAKFLSPDIPAEALERQADEPPEEYALSLETAVGYFDQYNASYKTCIARYPAMQPPLTRAYRAWEARHSADIEFVARAQYAEVLRMFKGRADVAARAADASREAYLKVYGEMSDARLKTKCDWALSELTDPDDPTDGAIGDELQILRDWHAKHPLEDRP
jgi:hypothetical protein